MKGLRLYKKEKLCSETAINLLFDRSSDSKTALDYPLRAVWRLNPSRKSDSPIAFVISVPKRRLRHAVDRVAMRRKIREAYRLNRINHSLPDDCRIDVAFVYIADKLKEYTDIERSVKSILTKISDSLKPIEVLPH